MATAPQTLKPRHRLALRLIVLGMGHRDVAALMGMALRSVHELARCPAGREYRAHLEALADDYIARMLALGLQPRHLMTGPDKRKRKERRPWPRVQDEWPRQESDAPTLRDVTGATTGEGEAMQRLRARLAQGGTTTGDDGGTGGDE